MGVVTIKLADKLARNVGTTLLSAYPEMGTQILAAIALATFAGVVILFIAFEPKGLYHVLDRFRTRYRLYPFSY